MIIAKSVLAEAATELETQAGMATVTDATRKGYWKRIALALEDLAGAATSANDSEQGYQKRSAMAAEVLSGVAGSSASTYLVRVLQALEALVGASTGSIATRLKKVAKDYVPAPPLVNEYTGSQDLTTADWTKVNATTTSDSFTEAAVTAVHRIILASGARPAITSGKQYRVEVDITPIGNPANRNIAVQMAPNSAFGSTVTGANFDPETGTLNTALNCTATSQHISGSTYRYKVTATCVVSNTLELRIATVGDSLGLQNSTDVGNTGVTMRVENIAVYELP